MNRSAPLCTPEALEEQLRKHVMAARMIDAIVERFPTLSTYHSDFPLLAMEILISEEPELFERVIEDWSMIKTTTNEVSTGDMMDEIPALKGFFQLDNGVSVIGMELGLAEHHPVYAVIYHDGKQFRGYIPQQGNVYNRDTGTAFGLNPSKDSLPYLRDFGVAKKIEDQFTAARKLKGGLFYPLAFSQEEILAELNEKIKPEKANAA